MTEIVACIVEGGNRWREKSRVSVTRSRLSGRRDGELFHCFYENGTRKGGSKGPGISGDRRRRMFIALQVSTWYHGWYTGIYHEIRELSTTCS